MTQMGLLVVIFFISVIAFSTIAGIGVSAALFWNKNYSESKLPIYYGGLLGPFLAGLLTVLALILAPGAALEVHLSFVVAGLVLITWATRKRVRTSLQNLRVVRFTNWDLCFLILLLGWFVALIANATLLPLTQNDALEYAIAGRELFFSRDLTSYPVLNPETNVSGFFGPWTHPPLYVALIYLTSVVQGTAETPGLMRLISPWFAIAGTLCIYGVACRHGRSGGFVAALLFVSAPLMFLGSDSGLIDSLTAAGFLVATIPIFAWQHERVRDCLLVGAATGIAMWTHSQAVLLIPMVILIFSLPRLRSPRALLKASGLFVVGTLLIGFWPYWRNFGIFGSPISDNPLVFALPSLQWEQYFTVGRGLGTFAATVQYGWLKGIFAVESYSFSFWFASVAFFYFFKSALATLRSSVLDQEFLDDITTYFSLLAIYQLGVIASTSAGISLMIKNERYLLSVLPFAAILSGSFIGAILDRSKSIQSRRVYISGLKLLFVSVLVLQALVFSVFRLNGNGLNLNSLGQSQNLTLLNRPEFQVIRYLREETPMDALVLSLKPADMYYASRRMISYLDPRLLNFYGTQSSPDAASELLRLGVKYIHLPDYGIPPIYNSALMSLLNDPTRTELVFSADGNQIYRLGNSGLGEVESLDVSPDTAQWTVQSRIVIGGRKMIMGKASQAEAFAPMNFSATEMPLGLFNRDWSESFKLAQGQEIPLKKGSEYTIEIQFSGMGFGRIWFSESEGSKLIKGPYLRSQERYLALDLPVTSDQKIVRKRILPKDGAASLNVEVESVGNSRIMPLRVRVTRYAKAL